MFIFWSSLLIILCSLAIALQLAAAGVLVRNYLRTRNIGFAWLGLAAVIWPLLSKLIDSRVSNLVDRVLKGQPIGFFPFSLVQHGQMSVGTLVMSLVYFQRTIGPCLLLIAVLYLGKSKSDIQPSTLK